MIFIDSHAHLTLPELWNDIDLVLEKAFQADVKKIVNICSSVEEVKKALTYQNKQVTLLQVAAPSYETTSSFDFDFFSFCVKEKKICALGEVGLDYYYNKDKVAQKDLLKRYFELALEKGLPIVIHCRDAFDDLFSLADNYYSKSGKLLLHCFTGNQDDMEEAIKRGWKISFSGILTFTNAENLRAVAKATPLSSMMVETDSPFLAPVPFRGKRNEPAYVIHVAKALAAIKNLSLELLSEELQLTTEQFFS